MFDVESFITSLRFDQPLPLFLETYPQFKAPILQRNKAHRLLLYTVVKQVWSEVLQKRHFSSPDFPAKLQEAIFHWHEEAKKEPDFFHQSKIQSMCHQLLRITWLRPMENSKANPSSLESTEALLPSALLNHMVQVHPHLKEQDDNLWNLLAKAKQLKLNNLYQKYLHLLAERLPKESLSIERLVQLYLDNLASGIPDTLAIQCMHALLKHTSLFFHSKKPHISEETRAQLANLLDSKTGLDKSSPLYIHRPYLLILHALLNIYKLGRGVTASIFNQALTQIVNDKNKQKMQLFPPLLMGKIYYVQSCFNRYHGEIATGKRTLEKAITCFTDSIEQKIDPIEAQAHRACMWGALEKPEDAIQDAEAVLKQDPSNILALEEKGEFHRHKGEHELALACFDKILNIEPARAFALASKGAILRVEGEANKAKKYLEDALAIEPGHPFILVELARLYKFEEDYPKALEFLDAALKISPTNSLALASRGYIYMKQENYLKALEDLDRSLELKPNKISSLLSRAHTLFFLERYNDALVDLKTIISLKPNHIHALRRRGEIYLKTGLWEKAFKNFDRALKQNRKDPVLLHLRAEALQHQGEHFKALLDLNFALQIDPNNLEALRMKGDIHQINGEYTEALRNFNLALEKAPHNIFSKICRGHFYLFTGECQKAVDDFTEALQQKPKHVLALIQRSEAYHLLGNHEKALEDLRTALALDPKRLDAIIQRAGIYFALQRYELAAEDVETVLNANHTSMLVHYAHAVTIKGELQYASHEDQIYQTLFQAKKALEADPTHWKALLLHSKVQLRMSPFLERLKEAENDFAQAQTLIQKKYLHNIPPYIESLLNKHKELIESVKKNLPRHSI